MGSIKDETIAKLSGQKHDPEATVNGVKKKAEDMNIVQDAMNTARQLSGANDLEQEIDRKDKKLEKVEGERDKAIEGQHKAEIENVKIELGAKIDNLAKSYAAGAPKESIADQIAGIKKAANELGMGGSKVAEIREIMGLVTSLNPKTNLAEQVKEARDLLTALQPADKKPEGTVEGVPAEIAVQLKKMDHDLQITLAKMEDDRQHRDQEFQLTLRRYDEERLSRQEKLQMDYQIQKERNDIIAGGFQMVGKAAGKAYAEALTKGPGGGIAGIPPSGQAPGAQKSYHIELNPGEAGTMECPNCKGPVGVGPETQIAECVGCHSKFEVVRVAPSTITTESEE